MNEFFESLAKRWKNAAERLGAKIEEPKLDEKVAAEILELARVAAHPNARRRGRSTARAQPAPPCHPLRPSRLSRSLLATLCQRRRMLPRLPAMLLESP